MNYNHIISELEKNIHVFKSILENPTPEFILWKSDSDKWCLLEIVCHLYDEEVCDFRVRLQQVLSDPKIAPPPIDPEGWVKERKYLQQNYEEKLWDFLTERENSIRWLQSLENPNWENLYQHPQYGALSAKMFFTNWLAHDYLHIRQIMKLQFDYLSRTCGENLNYAGDW